MRYNNYHKHDHVSNLWWPDSNCKAEEYIKKCVEYGHTNYFTTNHGSFGDIFEAKSLCDKYGLRCIAGIEGYIVPDPSQPDASNYHIVIIPKTNAARKKVNYISSMASIEGFYRRPRINPAYLLELDPDDVFITTACIAGLLKDETSIEQIFMPLYRHFGSNVMLEIQSHDHPLQIEINRKALALADELHLELIAANDSHYVETEEATERANLLKGKGKSYGDEDSFILDFPSYKTMVERFRRQSVLTEDRIHNAIIQTLCFDDCEEIYLDKTIKMPTAYPNLSLDERVDLLKKQINERFKEVKVQDEITKEEMPRYLDAIRYEMKTIEDTNDEIHTADYFLLNTLIVDKAVNEYGGVLTRGGRGSCASFYINRLLGMTQLDRLRINLPIFPDRFASTARLLENRSLPDIDYNVKEQEPFVRATRDILGEHGCYPMVSYKPFQLSEAFRNVCRTHGLNYVEYNDVAKHLEQYTEHKRWRPLIEEAQRYVGTIVAASVHPCAFCLSNDNLLYELGVTKIGDALCVLMTSGEADEWKYLKDDFLVVSVWSLIDNAFKAIGQPIIPARQLLAKIKDDPKVWELFQKGLTRTLNQVDSDNGREQAMRYGVSSFEDAAFIAAAIRPSFDSWRPQFLARQAYTTGSKDLDKVLEMTGGYILFQENLMQYFDWLGVSPAESIGLIKKISKKKIHQEDFDNLEARLKENWIKNTGSEDMFLETWGMIQSCISYGFSSAHAAAVALDACYGAYLKAYYPLEYYTVCFNLYAGATDETEKIRAELPYFGIKMSDPVFRHSTSEYTYDKATNTIYKGLASIKHISKQAGDDLYMLRNRHFDSFVDLLYCLKEETSVDAKQREILIKANYFQEFGDIKTLLAQALIYKDWKDKSTVSKKRTYDFDPTIADQYLDDTTKGGTSDARWKITDTKAFIKTICQSIHRTTTTRERIVYKLDSLGYVDYVNPNLDKRLVIVTALDTTYSPRFTAYCLATGQTCDMKVHKQKGKHSFAWFSDTPFEVGDILYMDRCDKEPRRRQNDKGQWVPIPGSYDWWLNDYHIANSANINV